MTGASPTMKAVFGYESRSDYQITDYNERCVQAMWSDQRLKTITIYVNASGWQRLRQYELGYGYSSGTKTHSLLTSLKQYGYSANSDSNRVGPLNTYTFGYSQMGNHAQVYLTTADNGWGGKSTYTYQSENTIQDQIEDDHPNTVTGAITKTYRKVVKDIKLEDGLGDFFSAL
ncbi:MAG: hypothetical protein R3A44_41165 [Caldilineaceae bacterium]